MDGSKQAIEIACFLPAPEDICPIYGQYLLHRRLTISAAIGPYSRPAALAKLDGRTKEARLMAATRAELIAHVGGTPSATQRALIERAVQLTLRVAAMDRKFAEGASPTEHDTNTYLAWSNSLSRLLRQIGLNPAKSKAPDLAEYLAARAAA